MKRISIAQWARGSALVAAAALAAMSAQADYGNIGGPGVYFGSGNVDGNWTFETASNVQVAIRAKDRATLQTLDGSSGVYGAGYGLVGGNKAAWNYEFSVNLRADGTGNMDFSDVTAQMFVDIDPTAGFNWQMLDIESNWPDNCWWDGSAPRRCGATPLAGEYGAQQSANPLFGDSGFAFNPGAGLYGLRLVVSDNTGDVLSSVETAVQIPEPGSLALVGLALAGLGYSRRRKG